MQRGSRRRRAKKSGRRRAYKVEAAASGDRGLNFYATPARRPSSGRGGRPRRRAAHLVTASTLTRMRKVPVCLMPSRNCTLTESPAASGWESVIVPTDSDVLKPPPLLVPPVPLNCVGGSSTVVPWTVTVHGAGPPHVSESPTFKTETWPEESARRSATPGAAGKVVTSTMRKRSWATGAPVLFV